MPLQAELFPASPEFSVLLSNSLYCPSLLAFKYLEWCPRKEHFTSQFSIHIGVFILTYYIQWLSSLYAWYSGCFKTSILEPFAISSLKNIELGDSVCPSPWSFLLSLLLSLLLSCLTPSRNVCRRPGLLLCSERATDLWLPWLVTSLRVSALVPSAHLCAPSLRGRGFFSPPLL